MIISQLSIGFLCTNVIYYDSRGMFSHKHFRFVTFFIGNFSSCDLAGSERIKKTKAEGERLSEAQHINFSLLELG